MYRLTKTSIGTPEAISAIVERWNLQRKRISYGGLKDRHAVTTQHLTIYSGPRKALRQDSFVLEYLGQTNTPFTPPDFHGNRFQLVLRDMQQAEVERAEAAVARAGESGGVLDVEEEPGEEAGEVGGGPVAVEVGFGEADVTGEDAFAEESGAEDAEVGGGGEAGGHAAGAGVGVRAELEGAAFGEVHAQVAELHVAEGGDDHAAAQRAAIVRGGGEGGDVVEDGGGRRVVAHGAEESGWRREREAWGR